MAFREKRKEFFYNFLDNLLNRYLKEKQIFWLTYKQSVNIVNNNLEYLERCRYKDEEGSQHIYYICDYKNYRIMFAYSSKNCCYNFSANRIKTPEEREEEELQEKISFYKKHISLHNEIDNYITMSYESIEDNQELLKEATKAEDIKMWTNGVNNAKKRLAFWQKVKQAVSA